MFVKMKKILAFLIVLSIFASCEKELAKKPDRLIEKDKMVNIMYDLSLLGAMRNQNPVFLDSFKNNSNEYIYKKHKIDSTQFVQSNIYYAADYKEYKKMYEEVKTRLNKNVSLAEAAVKVEKKKTALLEKKIKKQKEIQKKDSIKKAKLKMDKEMDSLKKILSDKKKRRVQIKK